MTDKKNKTKIKICGLRRTEDIDFVNEFLPDYIGFVFANTRRKISYDTAKILSNRLDGRIISVGVFVDEPMENVIKLCNDNIINVVQLHGSEDGEYISKIKNHTDKKIIKAVRVQTREQIELADNLPVDYLLLDAYNSIIPGGTGERFNWDIIPQNLKKLFFLAGGLSEKNLKNAIETVSPYGVDLSSSVETDGYKDKLKIKKVIDIVRKENGNV